jgi:hypothetical protein
MVSLLCLKLKSTLKLSQTVADGQARDGHSSENDIVSEKFRATSPYEEIDCFFINAAGF